MKKNILYFITLLLVSQISIAQDINIQINVAKGKIPVSPYIYGRNNSLSDDPGRPITDDTWRLLRDAGVRIFRECGGNNCTKYNWRLKLSSHPDWYNNVYAHDWDYAATRLQKNIPYAQGLWGFQLIGKVAGSTKNNFGDWAYNQSNWWEGVAQNLAGGGTPNPKGTKALVEGNTDLYLTDWPADSTTAILDHWFGNGGIGLDKTRIKYWNMDNEIEIWNGTHDDVVKQMDAEEFMKLYFDVAKKARAKYPDIKLVGPVTANEWQWYNWNNNSIIGADGKQYPWLEYFIKRIGEEQKASGIRLLDVLDIHFYPGTDKSADLLQYHRIFFDKTYNYPEANGVKRVNGGWENSITKEYVFARCQEWLDKYIGTDHAVKLGLTESGTKPDIPGVTSLWYASTIGEFMKNGVEIFTPWDWKKGMWEVLHLYSKYNKGIYVESVSDQELYVSSYSTINSNEDSMTIILVNRHLTESKNTNVTINDFEIKNGDYSNLILSNLPNTETFISHTQNALKSGKVSIKNNSFILNLPALSITSIQVKKGKNPTSINIEEPDDLQFNINPNPTNSTSSITYNLNHPDNVRIEIISINGSFSKIISNEFKQPGNYNVELNNLNLSNGAYLIRLTSSKAVKTKQFMMMK